jgi:rhamnosyltransferase
MARPQVSVVIRVKNEARALADTLDLVFSQRGVEGLEVIVVDSGSTDGTTDVVRRTPARLIEIPAHEFSYGHALNIGVAAAEADRIVSLSAHSYPAHAWWLSALIAPLDDDRVAGVYGRHLLTPQASLPDRVAVRLAGVDRPSPRIHRRRVLFSNANSAFRRDLALTYPFDEALGGGKDAQWAYNVQGAGWCIRYEPRAAVFHEHNETLDHLLRRLMTDQPILVRLQLRSLVRMTTGARG